jgi:hypothetical protein
VQPLGPTSAGGETYRIDFDVKTISGGIAEVSSFDRIDVVNNLGTWLMPTRIVLEVAPISRASSAIAAGGSPITALIAVVMSTVRDISPIDIPRLPIIEG